jgi:hypothetical protein
MRLDLRIPKISLRCRLISITERMLPPLPRVDHRHGLGSLPGTRAVLLLDPGNPDGDGQSHCSSENGVDEALHAAHPPDAPFLVPQPRCDQVIDRARRLAAQPGPLSAIC